MRMYTASPCDAGSAWRDGHCGVVATYVMPAASAVARPHTPLHLTALAIPAPAQPAITLRRMLGSGPTLRYISISITLDTPKRSTGIFATIVNRRKLITRGRFRNTQSKYPGRNTMSTGTAGGTFDPQQALSQHVRNNFYVGGEWVKPQSDRTLELISPVTEECFLRVPEAAQADVDRAVKAARQAFDHGPWPRMTMAERAKYVTAIGEEMKKRLPLLIDVWTAQVGAPKSFAGFVIQYGPQLFEFYGQLGAKGEPVETREVIGGKAQIIREALIIPLALLWSCAFSSGTPRMRACLRRRSRARR